MEQNNESLLSESQNDDKQSSDCAEPEHVNQATNECEHKEDHNESVQLASENTTEKNDQPQIVKTPTVEPPTVESPAVESSTAEPLTVETSHSQEQTTSSLLTVASVSHNPLPSFSGSSTTSPRRQQSKSKDRTSTESSPSKGQRQKSVTKSPRNISPIAERSDESSVVSDPEANRRDRFRPAIVNSILSVHWLLSAAIFVTALALALDPPVENHACYSYFWIVYLRLAFWVFTYVQHDFIKAPCRKLINDNFAFYMDLSFYRKAPLQIVSFWNTMLLAAQNYIKTLFSVQQRYSNICANIGVDPSPQQHTISPQMFIAVFCGLETLALACFYLPGIIYLSKASRQREGLSFNRTLSNLDDIPITWRLKRQAEQVKLQRIISKQLRQEAEDLGLFDDD